MTLGIVNSSMTPNLIKKYYIIIISMVSFFISYFLNSATSDDVSKVDTAVVLIIFTPLKVVTRTRRIKTTALSCHISLLAWEFHNTIVIYTEKCNHLFECI